MPWCPKCFTEYQEGFYICKDCRLPLTEEEPVRPVPVPKPPPLDLGEPVLLFTVEEGPESGILLNALKNNQIPVLTKNRCLPSPYMSDMGIGTEVYVPQKLLPKALKLMKSVDLPPYDGGLPVMEEDLLMEDAEDEDKALLRQGMGRILLVVALAMLIIYIYIIWQEVSHF